ncbi:MAG TPA: hypothetical protein VKU02_12860 [Gemmataceae bacterium]|nr:hypothetical protein [Gemmataceae bacterium]
MDTVAQGMSRAGQKTMAHGTRPRKGENYRCESCGMQLQVTADCKCDEDDAHFRCCGQEMKKM